MLKRGLFVDRAGEEHAIHIIEEQQFYRIDITRVDADFQTDIESVEYSLVKRRNTFEYGDRRIYQEYLDFFDEVHAIHAESTKSSAWVNGKYEVTLTKLKPEINFYQETKTVNNLHSSDSIVYGGRSLTVFVVQQVYGVKLDPINFTDYEEVTLSMGTKSKETYNTPYIPLNVLKQRYDLSHIDKKDCVVADTLEVARTRLYEWVRSPSMFKGFDTETTGIDVDMYGDDHLVGIILAYNENQSTYFPFRHEEFDNLSMEFLDELMKWVIAEQDKLVAHNKKFDRKVMLKEGYDLRIKWDTFILSFLINPIIERGIHALKPLMDKIDKQTYLELENIFTSEKLINFAKLPKDIVRYYACPDAYNVIRLFKVLIPQLPTYQQKLFELECQLMDVKADQEFYGMRVDIKKFEHSYENTNYTIDMLLKAFRDLTKVDGNINSPVVLTDLIYNRMRCPVLVRTKTNRASTSSAAIKKLAHTKTKDIKSFSENLIDLDGNVVVKASDLASSKYPALIILEKYREYNKRKTAFYARFERTMKTGRIFFWINQLGTTSGRQSSPMHQLPPELKAVMISDGAESDLWGPDFSQVELRMIAYLSGQKDLIELCRNPENDIHRVIGSLISNKPMWAISGQERSDGKKRNFGVVYLISKFGLAGQTFGPGYSKEESDWCGEQLDAFYKRFKNIAEYIRKNRVIVESRGFMMTKNYNRIRLFNEILDPDISSKRKASLIRQANNLPVQGTAADYLKVAEVNIDTYIRNKGWYEQVDGIPKVRQMLSIHDEILISAHKSIPKEEIIEMIATCMEIPIEGAPPFFVQPALMDNWEGHSDDSLAIPIIYRDKLIKDYNETGKSIFKTSNFEVIPTTEAKEEIEKNRHIPIRSRAKLVRDLFQYEYLSGEYEMKLTDEEKEKAVRNYIESGKTVYEAGNYVHLLNNYREGLLNEYMNGLLAQYGTDYQVVGQKVRHDTLTHALLARYADELKPIKDLTHEELITEATKLYIDDTVHKTLIFYHKEEPETKLSDKDRFFGDLDNLINFDSEGEVIYDNPEDEDDEYVVSDYDDEGFIDYVSSGKVYRAWELADAMVVDVEELSNQQVNQVLGHLWKSKDDNGFYNLYIQYGGKLIDTKFKVEELDLNEITDFIESLLGTNVKA